MVPKLYNVPEECCGCQACSNVCPQNAISFKEDLYGFLFPFIDESLCIECHRCEKVCNFHHDAIDFRKEPIKGFAAVLRDKERLKRSASGGAFWAVAEWVIRKGGCVFGCVWDTDMNPIHTCAETIDQLTPMQGSKYVQSNVGDIYKQVKKKLDENRYVLFSGTPCQVAALRSILKNTNYEKLFTIDLVCHGVPNNKFFHQYLGLLEKQYNGKIVDFHFRHKRPDWLNGCIWIKLKKNKKYITKELFHIESPYFKMFSLRNQSCRLSCSECKYSCSKRVGDLTIGDFWGFQKLDIDLQYQGGLSCLLVNDAKIYPLIDEINMNLQEVSVDSIIQGNAQLRHPFQKDDKWDYVMESSSNAEFEQLAKEYTIENFSSIRRCRMKRAIPTSLLMLIKKIKNSTSIITKRLL